MNTVGNLKNPQARRGVLFFPDILEDRLSARTGLDVPTDDDVENDVADAFFELANSPLVGYRLGGNAIDPSEAVRHDRFLLTIAEPEVAGGGTGGGAGADLFAGRPVRSRLRHLSLRSTLLRLGLNLKDLSLSIEAQSPAP